MPEETTKIKHANVRLATFILLIILVAIAFGGAGYLYGINAGKTITAVTPTATVSATTSKTAVSSATSTTDVTANWKTYTNSDYGFSFKYPGDWTLGSEEASIYLHSPETVKLIKDGQFPAPDMWVGYYASVNKLNSSATGTLLEYLNKLASSVNGSVLKETTIGGQKSYDLNEVGEGGFLSIYAPVSEKIVHITFDGALNRDELSSNRSQIISTFQFTK